MDESLSGDEIRGIVKELNAGSRVAERGAGC